MTLEIARRDARRQALSGLIDYAGLFPPASLDLAAAVEEYRAIRDSADSWLVGRFICPADRLVELAGLLMTTMRPGEPSWSLVVTATPDDTRVVSDFAAEMGRAARIDAVEMRLPEGASVATVVGFVEGFNRLVYFEVPWNRPLAPPLEVLAAARESSGRALGAKIRCGGLTPDAFPPVSAVADFLAGCARLDLPVKATAGLHHPIRHVDPTTGFTHHGFLNLLIAGVLAHEGAPVGALAEVLAVEDAAQFHLSPAGLAWGELRFGAERIEAARRELFVGYGSCSIAEPVSDLTAMGILPVGS
ncbi:MAG TPA: hypothetical protein VFY15_07220 [Acidimicrobiia bacterium]|nr:hypothetical protein [Acidimicrobiia bacterium]